MGEPVFRSSAEGGDLDQFRCPVCAVPCFNAVSRRHRLRWQDLPIAIRLDTKENADVGYEHTYASRQAS